MKRTAMFTCIAAALFLVACPSKKPVTEEKVVIRGSNTFGEELAPRLVALYKKENPAVAFDLEFKGTSYGLGALMADACDIAAASREMNQNDLALARSRGLEFNDHVIGSYSVAVIVSAGSPVADLTRDQVRDIFTGAVQNWKDVGGPDAPIQLYIRDQISGTHLGFRELAMENKPYALGVKTYTTYRDLVQAVARDPKGIGYSSIDLAGQPDVKALLIGGVSPTASAVNKGQYPYERFLRLYTSKAKETPAAGSFVRFVQSARGQEILNQMGFVPHP